MLRQPRGLQWSGVLAGWKIRRKSCSPSTQEPRKPSQKKRFERIIPGKGDLDSNVGTWEGTDWIREDGMKLKSVQKRYISPEGSLWEGRKQFSWTRTIQMRIKMLDWPLQNGCEYLKTVCRAVKCRPLGSVRAGQSLKQQWWSSAPGPHKVGLIGNQLRNGEGLQISSFSSKLLTTDRFWDWGITALGCVPVSELTRLHQIVSYPLLHRCFWLNVVGHKTKHKRVGGLMRGEGLENGWRGRWEYGQNVLCTHVN